MYEQRIEIPNVLRWYLKQWKIMAIGVIFITIVSTIGFYTYARNAYTVEMSKRLTKEEFEATMDEEDCQVAKAVLNIDELLVAKNQRLQDLNEEYEDPSSAGEDALVEKEELIQRIYWLDQLRQMYFIDFSDEQARYYNLLCGNEYPPMAEPSVTARMIFQGALLGIFAMVALIYLIYILGGYLHSAKEMKVNFKAPVCVIKKQVDDKEQNLKLLMEVAEMERCEMAAIVDMTQKSISSEKEIVDAASTILKAEVLENGVESASAQQCVHNKKNVYVLVTVNESKVTRVKKLQEFCENVGAEIKGIIVITE